MFMRHICPVLHSNLIPYGQQMSRSEPYDDLLEFCVTANVLEGLKLFNVVLKYPILHQIKNYVIQDKIPAI